MKIRQKLLLEEILRSGPVGLEKLAGDFSVSTKTIRNDLEELGVYLRERTGENCLSVLSGMAGFCGSPQARAGCSVTLDNYYLYKLSAEERVIILLAELIASPGNITIDALAEKLCVSRGTVNSDLAAVKDWCRENGVRLVSRKGKGLCIEEDAAKRRELLTAIIRDFNNISGIKDVSSDSIQLYKSLFAGIDLGAIKEILMRAEDRFAFILSDEAYEELVIQIALSVKQTPQGPPCECPVPKERVEYRMAREIVRLVNERFSADLSDSMVDFIAVQIRGESFQIFSDEDNPRLPYIQFAAEKLLLGVGEAFGFDFKMDPKLYDGLIKHLCAAVFRIRNRLTVQNPLRDTLIAENRPLYDAIRANCAALEQTAEAKFSDDELSYLLIYFATAMEREKQSDDPGRRPAVAVVCGTGKGTAQIVQQGLEKYFDLDIRCLAARHQLERVEKEQRLDFLVSTVPLDTALPYVQVSPLLRRQDIENINKLRFSLGFAAGKGGGRGEYSSLARRALACIDQNPQSEEALVQALRALLDSWDHPKKVSKEEAMEPMLSDVLRTEYMRLDVPAGTWEEAVTAGGRILLENGVVEETYIQAAIQNVRELGPYIVLTKGVAIPHASRQYGVHQTAMSFARLAEPVEFGSEENDPVRFVFTLATVDSSSHLTALRDLVALFDDGELFKVLDRARSPEEITAFIQKFEREKGAEEE